MPKVPKVHNSAIRKRRNNQGVRDRQRKRFYPTNSKEWRLIRCSQLTEHPLCSGCQRDGYVTEATEVDHISGDASTLESNASINLQSLCKPCHSKKTARERGG